VTFATAFELPTFEDGSSHNIDIQELATAGDLYAIASVAPAINLVDKVQYDVKLFYQDGANNPAASHIQRKVTFDATTEIPEIRFPISGTTFKVNFKLIFFLPENALSDSVKVKIIHLSGSQDPITERELQFSNSFTSTGEYSITFRNISEMDSTSEISSIANAYPLVHLGVYAIGIEYRDYLGNDRSQHVVTCTHDTYTILPEMVSPSDFSDSSVVNTSFTFASHFVLAFTVSEDAMPGSLRLILTPSNYQDRVENSSRILRFASSLEVKGAYSIVMKPLSVVANEVPEVSSVTPAIDLVHNMKYDITFGYRDTATNLEANVTFVSRIFDAFTESLSLYSPMPDSSIHRDFDLTFNIPETAQRSTLTLSIFRVGGLTDDNPPREIKFDDAMDFSGNHTISFIDFATVVDQKNSIAPDPHPLIKSITPSVGLVDGALYNFFARVSRCIRKPEEGGCK
jgi:hypothetical protein